MASICVSRLYKERVIASDPWLIVTVEERSIIQDFPGPFYVTEERNAMLIASCKDVILAKEILNRSYALSHLKD
jgi:hypothetical protein